ncbi:MAG: large-conductance mechanosensitive channel protein MscL [Peptococcaceae bacterium]|jgi:large conductance mechanosensitive channel|nr:large-conductance mechanosensitive channel protein MscL [Peptococcaceae bacterium]MBQ5683624.1 large-conductance mechanosensitive channel protein MscL [Peptococcaceae bacterium]MBQ5703383.1 large-conductance mechanosensitive channel protein MscL [Peptococcaceae bacterium]MBQ5859237.1 large-conductance mechanosensitive channel protein MscL [Peptococcaceae bacterium]
MWKEFKEFAFKGNVLDMSIGVIIGGAFGKIVTSLVNDIIMPFFGFLTAGTDFTSLKVVLSPAVLDAAGNVLKPEAALMYGNFIQNIFDFFIIAFCIFFFVQQITKLRKKEEAPAPEPAPAGPSTEELLAEIRDLLKQQNN